MARSNRRAHAAWFQTGLDGASIGRRVDLRAASFYTGKRRELANGFLQHTSERRWIRDVD